jgi:hypothetical protein
MKDEALDASVLLSAEVERELRHLAVRYASAADRRDRHAMRDVFASEATLLVHRAPAEEPFLFSGADAIGGVVIGLAKYTRTMHVLGQAVYAVTSAASAVGEVYCIAHHVSGGEDPTDLIMHIRYHDDYVFADERWSISRREVFVDFTTSVPIVGNVRSAASATPEELHQ